MFFVEFVYSNIVDGASLASFWVFLGYYRLIHTLQLMLQDFEKMVLIPMKIRMPPTGNNNAATMLASISQIKSLDRT
jgi:hypothetical protein